MNQLLIHKEGDLLAVTRPVGITTIDQLVEALPPGTLYVVINAADLPEDRYFRDAWTLGETGIVVDIEKAKDIQRDHWRRLRTPKLEALDLDFMRALEAGESLVAIAAAKTALRDVTETELSGTLEEIKANIPAILL
jgi:hypothetical protein